MDSKISSNNRDQIATANYKRVIDFIRVASNDSEKLAALFLVTQLFKTGKPDPSTLKEIYQAVGATFLTRLIVIPEIKSESMYLTLGLNILACFTGDADLVRDSGLQGTMYHILKILLEWGPSNHIDCCEEVIDNCLVILYNLVGSYNSSQRFFDYLETSSLLSEDELISRNCHAFLNIFTRAFEECGDYAIKNNHFCKILLITVKVLAGSKDEMTFRILESVNRLMAGAMFAKKDTTVWNISSNLELREVMCTVLRGILQSRVPSDVRITAILLSRYSIELFGVDFILFQSNGKNNLLAAILALAAIEVKVLTETKNVDFPDRKKTELVAYFAIAEKVIIHLVNMESGNTLETGDILKTNFGLNELMSAAMVFFKFQVANQPKEKAVGNIVVIAVYRTICAWLSEETDAMREDVRVIIPDMVALATENFKDDADVLPEMTTHNTNGFTSRPKLLQFLMPVLCHLSADESTRKILLDNKCLEILKDYFDLLLKGINIGNEFDYTTEQFETVIGVFMNMSITEPKLTQTHQVFIELRVQIFTFVPDLLDKTKDQSCHTLLNTVALGLILFRNDIIGNMKTQGADTFLQASLSFLLNSCPSQWAEEKPSLDNEISELWCVSACNLIHCLSHYSNDKRRSLLSLFSGKITALSSCRKDPQSKKHKDIHKILVNFSEL